MLTHGTLTKYSAWYQCRQPSHIAEGRRVQRVDTGQFRDPTSAGQGSDVVHSPQNQLTINGVWVVESPCSCITKLLPVSADVEIDLKSYLKETRS